MIDLLAALVPQWGPLGVLIVIAYFLADIRGRIRHLGSDVDDHEERLRFIEGRPPRKAAA